jgi:2-polyprenyl-3-methyl-5-hydroxy-6-metoxy-1,4-benzoquinol methylase
MNTKEVIDLAIKRHDIDAEKFQHNYLNEKTATQFSPFFYGRNLILQELETLLNQLPPNAKVLDIGSGTGHLTDWIRQKGFTVEGIEPAKNMLAFAQKNFPDIAFFDGLSSSTGRPAAEYDLIVAFEVLRYLDAAENKKSYQEFFRLLKNDGYFFVTQVNRKANDGYYYFYHAKGFIYRLLKKTYHFCHFTSSQAEERTVLAQGFKSVKTVGRMSASLRIAKKFGNTISQKYRQYIEKTQGEQRFTQRPQKDKAAHLIVIGQK